MELFLQYACETFDGLILPTTIAALGCLGFGFIFNIRRVDLLAASIGGALSWFVYLIMVHYSNDVFACFMGGIFVSLYSEIAARILRTPSTCYLIIGLLPLVPGAGIYYTMKFCVQGQYAQFAQKGMSTLTAAGAIALGVMLVISIVRMLLHLHFHIHFRRKKKAQ